MSEEYATLKYTTYIYTFYIGSLEIIEGQKYEYWVQNADKRASLIMKVDIPEKIQESVKFLVFGDLDSNWDLNISKPTFDWLEHEVTHDHHYDGIIYVGDMAYDLETEDCLYGEWFLKNISSFTQRYPFMPAAGNHDSGENDKFTYFSKTFSMPSLSNQRLHYAHAFYSFEVGPVHFLQFDPYFVVYNEATPQEIQALFQVVKTDLEQVDRNATPWVIVYQHYPFYCSGDDSFYKELTLFEDLFVKHQVDLHLNGHEHEYDRLKPYYKNETSDWNVSKDYHYIYNHTAPLYIIEGASGNQEIMPTEPYPVRPNTIIQNINLGLGILTVHNKTHIHFEHRLMKTNLTADYFWVIKYEQSPVIPEVSDKGINAWLVVSIIFIILFVISIVGNIYFIRTRIKTKTYNLDLPSSE